MTRFFARLSVPPAASRMLPSTVTFFTCGRWLPLFENFRTLTTFGPGSGVVARPLFLVDGWAPEHEQLADVLNRRRAERLGELVEQGGARFAIVREHAHFHQAVRSERGVDLAPHGRGGAIVADGDHRVEVMGIGALLLASGRE